MSVRGINKGVVEITLKKPKLIVNEGEELCEECKGKKYIEVFVNRKEKIKLPCGKCGGNGKIDWIQKATGVHESSLFPEWSDGSSYSSISISATSSSCSCSSSSGQFRSSGSTISNTKQKTNEINNKFNTLEERLCHVLQRFQNMVKSTWVVIKYHLTKVIKLETVKILKYFKIVIT